MNREKPPRCPRCGSKELTVFVDMRRAVTDFTVTAGGELDWIGYGYYVDESVDYVACNQCDAHYDPEEFDTLVNG